MLARRITTWGLWCAVIGAATAARAADYFLTVGGGYAPSGNQVSLEKNVHFFQQLLGDLRLTEARHDILFSDGDSRNRDLQYIDPAQPVPRVNLLVARVFNKENDLEVRFRKHSVPGTTGASSPENLDRWFETVGEQLGAGDRVVVYLTGHGGKGKEEQNPHFFMWHRKQVPVKDFVERLDKLNPRVQVVLVMVQCYSGGFANCIFNEGNPEKGLSAAQRCGFYATVHDRRAAGCTPDIDDENYQEYSSSFWAAIGGHSRTGDVVRAVDCNADGQISFAEAHAYTVINSNTIDIPVKTSDAFLRTYSKTAAEGRDDLTTAEVPYADLTALASPVDRAVLDGLSAALGLKGDDRTKDARRLAEKLERQRANVERDNRKLTGRYERARGALADMLKFRWPELENPWNPQAVEDLQRESGEIVAAIEHHSRFSEFERLHQQIADGTDKALDLEREWAKCQRFLRFAENVALASNLAKVADPQIQKRYSELVTSEAGHLCSAGDIGPPVDDDE